MIKHFEFIVPIFALISSIWTLNRLRLFTFKLVDELQGFTSNDLGKIIVDIFFCIIALAASCLVGCFIVFLGLTIILSIIS